VRVWLELVLAYIDHSLPKMSPIFLGLLFVDCQESPNRMPLQGTEIQVDHGMSGSFPVGR
jgi:hypothetical protein